MNGIILLVEDNEFIRNMYKLKLTKAKYKVEEAEDGAIALSKIPETKPDVILLDLMMPNVGGLEVLKELNKQKKVPNLPVIVLTNMMDPKTADDCIQLGACDYIIKTDVTPAEVVAKVQKCIVD